MAEEMVEAVKAAMALVPIDPDARWSDLTDDEMGKIARAAIEAVRTPTEAMVDAAWPYGSYAGPAMDHFKTDLTDYWQAMIDAALPAPTPPE